MSWMSGQDQNTNALNRGTQVFDDMQTVNLRHLEIDERDIRLKSFPRLDCLPARGSFWRRRAIPDGFPQEGCSNPP